MLISKATWRSGVLQLNTIDPEAVRFVTAFELGEYDIVRRDETQRKHRSLDANAYAWVLIDKLAAAMHLSKAEIYRSTIRDIGGSSVTLCVEDKAVETFKRTWERRGLGWQVETFESKLPGCTNINAYYGSSAYDTKQMSILIDHLIEDCKALGIETLSPEKLKNLLDEWEKGC